MTSNTRTPVEVRRALAEALGWYVEVLAPGTPDEDGFFTWARLYAPDGIFVAVFKELEGNVFRYEADHAWDMALNKRAKNLPDWPHDLGEALALCLDIAEKYDPLQTGIFTRKVATTDIDKKYAAHLLYLPFTQDAHAVVTGWGTTPAEALSRLALSALEDAAQDRADDE